MYKIMDGNEACSYVAYNFTELAGIYPITPASPIAEHVDVMSNGDNFNFFGNKVKVLTSFAPRDTAFSNCANAPFRRIPPTLLLSRVLRRSAAGGSRDEPRDAKS